MCSVKRYWVPVACLFLLCLTIACSKRVSSDRFYVAEENAVATDLVSKVRELKGMEVATNETVEHADMLPYSRMLIKNAHIRFELTNPTETNERIQQLLEQFQGYITEENEHEGANGKTLNGTIVIKVPSHNFDAFMEELLIVVKKFSSKNIYTEDVTAEFIDNEARLRVQRDVEARYLQILEKAQTVSEILEVENELQNIRSSIETLEARQNYFKNQVAFSTISLVYFVNAHSTVSIFSRILDAFMEGGEILLGIISLWPLIIIIVVLVFIVRKILKKRKLSKQGIVEKETT